MPFICYVYSRDATVPHMEILPDATLAEARALTRVKLLERPSASRAELWENDRLIGEFQHPKVNGETEVGA